MSTLRRFDLNLLRVFTALMEERHVTRAAERLHLSQPALSHALRRLREALDDPLLVKTEAGMRPTPRAEALLPRVRQALALLETGLAPPTPFDPATSTHHFVIATTDYFEEVLYPAFLAGLRRRAPGITLEIALITDEVLHDGLAERRIDLVVGPEAVAGLPAELVQHPWMTEELVCLAARDNAAVGEALDLEAFVACPQVALADISGLHAGKVDTWLAAQGLSRRVISQNLNYMAAARIVAGSEALMVLPRRMAELFAGLLPVHLVTPPPGLPRLEMQLIHHGLYAKEAPQAWLRQQLLDFAAEAEARP